MYPIHQIPADISLLIWNKLLFQSTYLPNNFNCNLSNLKNVLRKKKYLKSNEDKCILSLIERPNNSIILNKHWEFHRLERKKKCILCKVALNLCGKNAGHLQVGVLTTKHEKLLWNQAIVIGMFGAVFLS